jgi:transglutaminase-like putative cysteine protease
MTKKIIVALLFLPALAMAQTKDVYEYYKAKFPDEPAVYVERSEVMNVFLENDSLRVYSDVYEDLLLLKEQADYFSGKRVYGSHFNQVEKLKAKTLVWEKNRYKEMNVSDFKRNSDRDAGIFFDDSYYYSFNFPAVTSRNRTQLEYRENLTNARFISGYVFSGYLPQGKSSFTIKTTKDIDFHYEVLNDKNKTIQFKKTEKGNTVTYAWTANDLAGFRNEDNSPSLRYYAPHVICYVKGYQTKKGKVNFLNTLDDLYGWYYNFVDDLNKETSPQLQEVVKKIQSTSKSEIDVVRKVFYWVQENIQYIAFEQGMRGLIPHPGSYVCEKRYGDCKDMANLIVNLLQVANIKAYHTWIGTRDIPYRYSQVPTPLVDNHMIATYISKEGEYYFLDATSDHTPFGYPSSMIQGKEALIGYDRNHHEVKVVPTIPKEKNTLTDSMSIQINGNQLTGTGATALTGFQKVFGGYELDRAETDDIKKYVTRLVGKGSNKFILDNYTVANLEERDKPTRIRYAFHLSDYFQKIGDEIYVNLNTTKDHYNNLINIAVRKTPIESDYKFERHEYAEFTLPEGYGIEYLPPNSKFERDVMGLDISYRLEGNKVIYTKKFYLNYLMLTPDRFSEWNEVVKSISDIYKESLIIKKK